MSTITTEPNLITIISLTIAGLAVIVGPLISIYISKKQTESSVRIATHQLLGPMRQVWINDLRDLIVELASNCIHYWETGTYDDLENEEYRRITHVQQKIQLMLNLKEKEHNALFNEINKMVTTTGGASKEEDKLFFNAHSAVIKTAQNVFKKEWDVIRNT